MASQSSIGHAALTGLQPASDDDTDDPLLTAARPAKPETEAITKALRSWFERAGVRTDPRRLMREEQREGLHYWPPALAGFVEHPLVTEWGAAVRLRRDAAIPARRAGQRPGGPAHHRRASRGGGVRDADHRDADADPAQRRRHLARARGGP